MKNSGLVSLLVMFSFSILVSCTHQPYATPSKSGDDDNTSSQNNTQNNGNTTVDTGVCFQRDILPIFISNCAKSGCHDAATRAEDIVLNNYANIMNSGITPGDANGSSIYRSLSGTNPYMPQYPNTKLTSAQQAMIQSWINQGAHNDTNCTAACDTTLYTYAAVIKPIMTTNCIGCHNSSSASAGIILDTYAGVQAVALNGKLVGAINGTSPYRMMPQGGNKLMSCEITQITKWVNAGAPNN